MIHDLDFNVLPHLLELVFASKPAQRAKPFIIDVGANRGQSITSIKELLPNSLIHSFELNPEFHEHLFLLASEYEDVFFHPFGLGANSETVKFYVPSAGGIRYLEEASMVPDEYDKPWVKDRWKARGTMTLEEFHGNIVKGDDFRFRPDLIKIDVEGAESEVVLGLHETIIDTKPVLLVENGDWPRIWPILEPLGYIPMMPDPDYASLIPFAGARTNTFYAPEDVAHSLLS